MEPHQIQQAKESTPIITSAVLPATHHKIYLKAGIVLLGALALTLALFFGLATAAADSLPGEPLYGFKTSVAEEVTAFTKLSKESKATYAIDRIETRITELKTLAADTATSSPELLARVAELSNKHADDVHAAVRANGALSPEAKINTLAELQNVLRAEEVLTTDTVELTTINDHIGEIEKYVADELRGQIHTFASTSDPTVVQSLIVQELTEVSEQITGVAPGSQAQGLVARRIADANEALAENELGDAIRYIFKAQEAMAVDRMLYDTERGFVDGQSKEFSGEVPEGN